MPTCLTVRRPFSTCARHLRTYGVRDAPSGGMLQCTEKRTLYLLCFCLLVLRGCTSPVGEVVNRPDPLKAACGMQRLCGEKGSYTICYTTTCPFDESLGAIGKNACSKVAKGAIGTTAYTQPSVSSSRLVSLHPPSKGRSSIRHNSMEPSQLAMETRDLQLGSASTTSRAQKLGNADSPYATNAKQQGGCAPEQDHSASSDSRGPKLAYVPTATGRLAPTPTSKRGESSCSAITAFVTSATGRGTSAQIEYTKSSSSRRLLPTIWCHPVLIGVAGTICVTSTFLSHLYALGFKGKGQGTHTPLEVYSAVVESLQNMFTTSSKLEKQNGLEWLRRNYKKPS